MSITTVSEALFSNVQQRVLTLIFSHPERSFYTSEIVRNVNSGTGAVERELSRLQNSDLVSVEWIGNQKHYRANQHSPIFKELRGIILKTTGLSGPLREALSPFSKTIKAAFVYGSIAKGTDTAKSDIDLMVIGDDSKNSNLTYTDLFSALLKAEQVLGRVVNPVFLSLQDWQRKLSQNDSVAAKIIDQSKIFILGSETDINMDK